MPNNITQIFNLLTACFLIILIFFADFIRGGKYGYKSINNGGNALFMEFIG
jgi:hypothetical protein